MHWMSQVQKEEDTNHALDSRVLECFSDKYHLTILDRTLDFMLSLVILVMWNPKRSLVSLLGLRTQQLLPKQQIAASAGKWNHTMLCFVWLFHCYNIKIYFNVQWSGCILTIIPLCYTFTNFHEMECSHKAMNPHYFPGPVEKKFITKPYWTLLNN